MSSSNLAAGPASAAVDTYRRALGARLLRRLDCEAELLDGPLPASQADRIYRDLARISRLAGIQRQIIQDLSGLLPDVERPLRIIELCAGNGWLSDAMAREFGAARPVEVIALDCCEAALDQGRRMYGDGHVRWQLGDAMATGVPDRHFDLAVQVQSLHHFDGDAAVALMQEMRRIADAAYVFDLRRTWYGPTAMACLAPVASREFVHDARISHQRAYAMEEAAMLAALTGGQWAVRRRTAFAMTLTLREENPCTMH